MCGWCSTCMLFFVLLLSFATNILVLANIFHPYSLQSQQSLCHDHEKLALLHLKHSFLVDCYASSSAFAYPKMKSWVNQSSSDDHVASGVGDCCRWDGVKCNEETGHVVGLNLSSSCLYGTFPHNSTIFHLVHLQELDLSNNHFNYSQIPLAIDHLSKLTVLNISYSAFTGQIPLGISKMSSMSILDLSGNDLGLQYAMGFEKLISGLTKLTVLNLDSVDISDVVPVSLRNLTSLKSLHVPNCNLYGVFPSDVFQLPNLEEVILYSNYNLRGHLPEFPSNKPLRVLDLGNTSFSGELTPSLGNLNKLTELRLWGTRITGSIPSSLGNLTRLTILELYNSSFKGGLPLSLTNLTQLTYLSLYDVHATLKTMDSWLLKLSKLETLCLHRMNISSEFPPAIANLTRISWLDLHGNQLIGPLPNWLANLTKLTFLDLNGNQFQGPLVPLWLSKLINLETFLLDSDHHSSSISMFEPFLKLPKLNVLKIVGVSLNFPPNDSITNSSLPTFNVLSLISCNLIEFPQFLHFQNELKLVNFYGNNIVGLIPQWFVNKTAETLLELHLAKNFIMGFEQPQIILPWKKLELMYIFDNMLHGRLPCPSPSLKVYQVSHNYLDGIVPKQICKGGSLVYLDLSSNKFNGHIPPCIGHELSVSLRVLNLGSNHFQGTIPETFAKACKLQMIDLSENQLEGKLPRSLIDCKDLELLNVGKNRLNDTFPSWLGSLPKLQILLLRHNKFHGMITTSESDHQFSRLRIIDLSNNIHDGELPSKFIQNLLAMQVTGEDQATYSSSSEVEITTSDVGFTFFILVTYPYSINITNKGTERSFPRILTVFRAFDFSSNNFTGVIPVVLGDLRGLQALNLSNNNLSSEIPSSLADFADLESLDLSQNRLSGKIPQQLTKLTSLEIFNLSHNHLEGLIPQGAQFNTFDNSSFDGNLALCGPPLSKECHNKHSPQPPPPPPSNANDEGEEDSMLIDWIIRLLGSVSGCIVGFVIGKLYITDRHHDWFVETFGKRTKPKPKPKPKARRSTRRLKRNG